MSKHTAHALCLIASVCQIVHCNFFHFKRRMAAKQSPGGMLVYKTPARRPCTSDARGSAIFATNAIPPIADARKCSQLMTRIDISSSYCMYCTYTSHNIFECRAPADSHRVLVGYCPFPDARYQWVAKSVGYPLMFNGKPAESDRDSH